jgi:hypothetical protein
LNGAAPPLMVDAMHRISFIAVISAFLAEIVVDYIRSYIQLIVFAIVAVSPGMSEADASKAIAAATESTTYLACIVLLGTATTIGGGYLAARIAKTFPYYNGLAIGIIGLAFQLYLWRMNPLWLNLFSVVTVIPASIYGAHLAKPHIIPPTE